MWVKYPIIIIIFFFLTVLQASLLPYFQILGTVPDFVFIAFYLLIFFEAPGQYEQGFLNSAIAGFFLDIFLPSYFGLSIITLCIIYSLHSVGVNFFNRANDKYLIFHFIAMFSCCFIFYHIFLYVISLFLLVKFNLDWVLFISLLYNVPFAFLGFLSIKISLVPIKIITN